MSYYQDIFVIFGIFAPHDWDYLHFMSGTSGRVFGAFWRHVGGIFALRLGMF